MEFNEKLQELRKRRGLTQEELANALYVSRTAVSKWESGRGYPNLESLKVLAKFFGVTIDALLSGEELLSAAEEDVKQKENRIRGRVFSVLDCSCVLLFFLPIFGQGVEGAVRTVSLTAMDASAYLKLAYMIAVTVITETGILSLIRHDQQNTSLICNAVGLLLFIISRQPYPATLLLVYLLIKVLLIKKP